MTARMMGWITGVGVTGVARRGKMTKGMVAIGTGNRRLLETVYATSAHFF